MSLLAVREHSRVELSRKLCRKGHAPDLVAQAIDTLCERGLLSDVRYAEAYVYGRMLKGHGPRKMLQALRSNGVADAVIHEALAAYDDEWGERAKSARVKKFGSSQPTDMKARAKQMRFLEQRGFTHEQIRWSLTFGKD